MQFADVVAPAAGAPSSRNRRSVTLWLRPYQSSIARINRRRTPVTSSLVAGKARGKPQLNRVLCIFCAVTRRALLDDGYPVATPIQIARNILFEFGLTLSLEFKDGFADIIDFPQSIVIDDDVVLLRQAAENVRPGLPNILRVLSVGNPSMVTWLRRFGMSGSGSNTFAPFVTLNSRNQIPNHATMLHEMVHAANTGSVAHDPEKFSVFFSRVSPNAGDPISACSRSSTRSSWRTAFRIASVS